jgi:hypothetical protein
MSRRRTMKRVASAVAPNDGTKFGDVSDAELLKEMARRRAARGVLDLDALEAAIADDLRGFGEDSLAATMDAPPPEDGASKPSPI